MSEMPFDIDRDGNGIPLLISGANAGDHNEQSQTIFPVDVYKDKIKEAVQASGVVWVYKDTREGTHKKPRTGKGI